MTCLWCFLYLTTVDRTIDRSFALLSFTNNNNSREDVRWIDRSHLTRIAHRWTEFNGNRRLLGQHQSMIIIISDRKSLHVIIGRNKRGAQMVIIYDCVLNVSETVWEGHHRMKNRNNVVILLSHVGSDGIEVRPHRRLCKGYNLDCGNSICYTQCYCGVPASLQNKFILISLPSLLFLYLWLICTRFNWMMDGPFTHQISSSAGHMLIWRRRLYAGCVWRWSSAPWCLREQLFSGD